MIQVDDKECIRRAYLLENKSQRQIAKELHHSRHTVVAAFPDPRTKGSGEQAQSAFILNETARRLVSRHSA